MSVAQTVSGKPTKSFKESLDSRLFGALWVEDLGWPFFLAALLTPFAADNGSLLIALLAVQFIMVIRAPLSAREKCLMCFLLGTVYSGVTFASIRLYDLVVLVALAYFGIVRRASFRMSILVKAFVGLAVVVALLFLSYSPAAVTQAFRFALSLACCVLFSCVGASKREIARCIMIPVAVALYCAVVMLARHDAIANVDGIFISTNFFLYGNEVRVAGFFSDPNKYMSFLLFMLFLIDWAKNSSKIRIENCLIFAGLLMTGSRTALISVALYLVYKVIRALSRNGFQALVFLFSIGITLLLTTLLITGGDIGKLVDAVWVGSAELFGRAHTLEINASLSEDNRILIWQYALDLISQSPLIGHGLDAYETLLPYPTHNTFLSLLLSGGLVYLLVFLLNTYPIATTGDPVLFIALILVPLLFLDLVDYRLLFCAVGIAEGVVASTDRRTMLRDGEGCK